MSRKKKMLTRIVTLMMALLMTIGLTIPAFAKNATDVQGAYNNLSQDDKDSIVYNSDSVVINGTTITAYETKPDESVMATSSVTMGETMFFPQDSIDKAYDALVALKSGTDAKANDQSVSGVSQRVKEISDAPVQANLHAAQDTLSGFNEILGTLLGILAYLIMMMLTVFTAIDIAYITIPPFRTLCDDTGAKSGGSGAMGATNKTTGEAKFRWVTDEAMYSVQTATIESGKSAIVTYLGKRILAIILVGIAVYLLLTGNIGLIMQLSLKMVSGIIDQIAALGMK